MEQLIFACSEVCAYESPDERAAFLDRLFAQIKREKGRIDVLFANAGFGSFGPVEKITEEHYDSLFNTNVKALFFTVLKAIPLMPEGSAIILNASIVASKGLPDFSVYSATKAAVRSFGRTLTTDLKARRIRVNAVSPGFTDTPAWHSSEASSNRWTPCPAVFRMPGLAHPKRSLGPCCFSPRTTAAT
jgi:NAD(P)-dependent dehydrogenase (short-subunit alcohol dehydrogenase family)